MDKAADIAIGAALEAERQGRHISQGEVARRMGRLQPFVSKVEHGDRGLRLSEAPAYAEALGMDVGSFMTLVERALKG